MEISCKYYTKIFHIYKNINYYISSLHDFLIQKPQKPQKRESIIIIRIYCYLFKLYNYDCNIYYTSFSINTVLQIKAIVALFEEEGCDLIAGGRISSFSL
jgi:hypothetical protein